MSSASGNIRCGVCLCASIMANINQARRQIATCTIAGREIRRRHKLGAKIVQKDWVDAAAVIAEAQLSKIIVAPHHNAAVVEYENVVVAPGDCWVWGMRCGGSGGLVVGV